MWSNFESFYCSFSLWVQSCCVTTKQSSKYYTSISIIITKINRSHRVLAVWSLWSCTGSLAHTTRVFVAPLLYYDGRGGLQMVQLQGKCYQKVEPLSQQATMVSFYNPATCFGECFKSHSSFRPWIPPEHIRVKPLNEDVIWTLSKCQAFIFCSSLFLVPCQLLRA